MWNRFGESDFGSRNQKKLDEILTLFFTAFFTFSVYAIVNTKKGGL